MGLRVMRRPTGGLKQALLVPWVLTGFPAKKKAPPPLAHGARGITEAKWREHLAWVKQRCRVKRYYLLQERQRTDPVASPAKKPIASRFYQLRMGKAHTGPYLAKIGEAADDKCWWCGSGVSQMREHLFKHCSQWKDQRVTMWRAVRKATEGKRTARNTSMGQLFGDQRCTAAILGFLATTKVGLRGHVARPTAAVGDDVQAEDDFVAENDVEAEDVEAEEVEAEQVEAEDVEAEHVEAVFDPGGEPWNE
jgi:hypothetical protein